MSGGLFFTLVILAFAILFVGWVEHTVKQARRLAAEEEREQAAEAARQAAEEKERRRAAAEAAEAEKQAEAIRVGRAVAEALVAKGVTVAERCTRCGALFVPDSRGSCSACGAPPEVGSHQ